MAEDKKIPIDYDTQWKVVISSLFPDFIKFFLPQAYRLIDFTHSIEFLEQELHKLISDKYKEGKVINDKLVKVRLKSGDDKWILIHIEVQSSFETDFAERMFTYFYRIYDRYDQKITAIAIYTGLKNAKKFDRYEYSFLGTETLYKFNTYKITSQKEKDLLASKNPFALVVLASQYLLKSEDDYEKRYLFKRKLIRLSKDRNYKPNQIINLLRFVDLILRLPAELEMKFEQEIIETYIKPKGMVTKRSERFSNQLHIALYGESIESKLQKEKVSIIENLLSLDKLTIKQIALAVNESQDFVKKVQKDLAEK